MTVQAKRRGPGRPPKRRNIISPKADIQRAMNTGMSLTQLKQRVESFIEFPEDGMDAKQILDYIKIDLQIWDFLVKSNKTFLELEEKYGTEGDTSKKGVKKNENVVAFSLEAG